MGPLSDYGQQKDIGDQFPQSRGIGPLSWLSYRKQFEIGEIANWAGIGPLNKSPLKFNRNKYVKSPICAGISPANPVKSAIELSTRQIGQYRVGVAIEDDFDPFPND